jgi:PAS domain S-box-containing protein
MIDFVKFKELEFTGEQFEKDILPFFLQAKANILFYQGDKLIAVNDDFIKEFSYQDKSLDQIDAALWSLPRERRRFLDNVSMVLSGQKAVDTDYLLLNGNGEETPASIQFGHFRIKDGEDMYGCLLLMTPPYTAIDKVIENLGEDIFRVIAEQSLNGIILVNDRLQLIYANPAALSIYGYDSFEEGAKVPIVNMIAPESLKMAIERARNWMEGGVNPPLVRFKIIRKDGEMRDVEALSHYVNIKGVRCQFNSIIDITERVRAEKALRESEQRFRSLVETTSDWVWEVDRNGVYIYTSPKVKDLLGYEPEEVIGKTPFNLMPGDEAERVAALFRDIVESRKPFARLENTNLHKDGNEVVIETSGVPIFDANGNLSGYRGIDRDITERNQAEEALLNAASEWKKTFDVIPDMIVVLDSEQKITRINKATTKAFGFSYKELLGKNYFNIINNFENSAEFRDYCNKTSDGKKYYLETHLPKLGGDFAITSTPILGDNGNVIGSVHVLRDITERKKAESELLEYEKQLRSLSSRLTLTEESERRRIASNLHDNVGQKLALSKIKLGALQKEVSSSEHLASLKEIQELIDETVKQTRLLISDISPPILYELGLEAAVEWIAKKTQEQHGIACEVEIPKQNIAIGNDVRVILFQAVREALFNVVKHAQASRVKISIMRKGEFIQIEIVDDGIGFEYHKKDRYWITSAGFGLFNNRERLNQIGGNLEIVSASGQGTKTILTAPLKLDQKTGEAENNEHKDYSS